MPFLIATAITSPLPNQPVLDPGACYLVLIYTLDPLQSENQPSSMHEDGPQKKKQRLLDHPGHNLSGQSRRTHNNVTNDNQTAGSSGRHMVQTPDPIPRRIEDAAEAAAGMKKFSRTVQKIPSVIDDLQSGLDTVDTVSSLLEPLKIFNSIANEIAHIHPYAKAVLSVFTFVSKTILDQEDRDNAVQSLLEKISDVYKFMNKARLDEFPTMQEVYRKVARQTLECADFIVHYSETKGKWKRLVKNVFKETRAVIQNYSDVLDALMQQFRDNAARGTVLKVYRIAEDSDLKDMPYVNGAGRDSSKCCLPGTRESILSEIETWIDNTGEDVERIFWLSGTAGKGKSAIAHTIAHWFLERGGAGAFFCFDRTREAEQRHGKMFATIARNLADHDPIIWRALASAVCENNELRHTTDIMKQWREFILGPVEAALKDVISPVLIVIDALDESGEARSREQILRALAGKRGTSPSEYTQLPQNIRILVTSRPLDDIRQSLLGVSHVRHVPMDDGVYISTESSEDDIRRYISTRLKILGNFNDRHFKSLAMKSDGLFEWARLACEYIKGTNMLCADPSKRFEAVVEGTSKGTRLLDDMYLRILEQIMPEKEQEEGIPLFRSVMGQILASLEPLSTAALNAMRHHFSHAGDHYNVDKIIHSLGSLVTGSAYSPVRPLHASFYDFLTDKSRSNTFFVDKSLAQGNLAFASLRVMEHDLRFNICSLENSYLPNSAVAGLEKRVESAFSPQLSYSCRFWGSHVGSTSVELPLAEEVRAFFNGDRLLFWLETLALLKTLSDSVTTLEYIAKWLTGLAEYTDIADAVNDTARFVRTFAPVILHSTPHLYLSALSLAPSQSMVYKKFIAKFPRSLRAVGGHIEHWPTMEKIIHVDIDVSAIAISPDGRRIVCGSGEGKIHMLDIVTGELLGAPLLDHTCYIWSLAISQNGDHIVFISDDCMVWEWDARTGRRLGAPFGEDTIQAVSVAISPDGTRIASGLEDTTIRVWDTGARKALYPPLKGHSARVEYIAISLDGNSMTSCADDGIRVWNINTGEALRVIHIQGDTDRHPCGISLNGNRIAWSPNFYSSKIQIWDAHTGKLLCLFGQENNTDQQLAFFPDGNSIMSGLEDGTIQIKNAQTGDALSTPLRGHTAAVLLVAVSPDGNRIVSWSDDYTIRVWDAGARNGPDDPFRGHTDGILSVAISPDGKHIVSGSADQTIRVWDGVTGGALCAPIGGHTHNVSSVATNGHLIVSGSFDGAIRMWDAMTHKAIGAPLEHRYDYISSVAISPDGTRIISVSDSGMMIYMWDDVTGWKSYEGFNEEASLVNYLAMSLDGNLIVSGSRDGTIRVWDITTREELDPLRHDAVRSVAISPDTKFIVSGSHFGDIRVWNRVTHETSPLNGHTDSVSSIAISLDGNLIVSSSLDKTIRVWNAMTGEPFGAPLGGHTDAVNSIAISPDGKHIVSGSWDKTIRVWDLEFFTQPQSPKAPAIRFSSNPAHALCSASSFLQDFNTSISLAPTEDGWVVGPEGRLLLWIPASLYPAMYTPGITRIISQPDGLELDLSDFAHGVSWHKCRANDGA